MEYSIDQLERISLLSAKVKIQVVALKGVSGWKCRNIKKELVELKKQLKLEKHG